MMSSASPHQRTIIVTLAVGAVILVALWMLAISPKRSESAEVRANVAAQQERLATAQAEVAKNQSAKKQYKGMLAELRRLDEAVPARGAIPDLLRQLQRRARVRNAELLVAALKAGSGGGATTGLTPGATPMPGGLAALPFNFTYSGKYFDLINVLKAARKSVTVTKSGDLKIDGRLVTIEGVSFAREDPDSPLIKASVSGTAYIAAKAPPPPTAAAPAAPATPGGS